MDNFLIQVEYNSGVYTACYANGQTIPLNANTYQDAVLESDLIDPIEYCK